MKGQLEPLRQQRQQHQFELWDIGRIIGFGVDIEVLGCEPRRADDLALLHAISPLDAGCDCDVLHHQMSG